MGTSWTMQNLAHTSGKEGEDQVKARGPMGEGWWTIALPKRGGGEGKTGVAEMCKREGGETKQPL
jgi:hypothetical protein